MPFIKTKDLNIHYEQAGAGEKTLLLVHGNFASWRWWRPVLDRLPSGYMAFAPDQRGFGDTDKPSNGYTIEQLADDLYGFVKSLSLSSIHLVGHSLGGAVALQFALNHLEQIETLTLVAPAPAEGMPLVSKKKNNLPWVSHLFEDFQRDRSLHKIDAINHLLRSVGANRFLLRRALRQMAPTLNYDDNFEALVDDACRMAPQAIPGFIQALDSWNVQPYLKNLRLPVLILLGDQDILIPKEALKRTARSLPHGKLIIWGDVGHSPQLEQPDRFVQLLREFINRGYACPGLLSRMKRVLDFFQRGKI
jgi:branched-chain amino acid transport system permease protein